MYAIRKINLKALRKFRDQEQGSMTVFGLFFFLCTAILGAFALDVMNIYAARTHLQTAADQAAHAALYNRALMDGPAAKIEAQDIVHASLPTATYGNALPTSAITFGSFDRDTRSFTVDEGSMSAVRVVTRFSSNNTADGTGSNGNPLESYLFKLIGFDQFNVETQSVYVTYRPGCLSEGFIAQGVVDLQSNNSFSNGFCIHSNTYVSLNSNNTFSPGTIVSMPNLDDLDLPRSGFATNDGLQAALRPAKMNIRVLSRIDNMIYRYENPTATNFPRDTEELPDYITDPTVISMTRKTVTTAELTKGRVHLIRCTSNAGLTINATDVLREVVVISPCEIKFTSGSAIEDARVISKNTASDSISSPSGLRVGKDDNCAEDGGAQLITMGGMSFPADLQLYGAQLMAKGDIQFAANANGVQGASMIAGGEISGTSNMDMGLCLTGMEDNIELDYYRLAL